MTETVPQNYFKMIGRGRGRGYFNKSSFEPARRPGTRTIINSDHGHHGKLPTGEQNTVNSDTGNGHTCTESVSEVESQLANGLALAAKDCPTQGKDDDKKTGTKSSERKVVKLLSKYNYKANPDEPGGFKELTVKLGQHLTLVNKHPTNEHWWNVQDEDGNQGYVPASYMKVLEDKLTALPWLQNKTESVAVPVEEKGNNVFGAPPKGTWVPYRSAYSTTDKLAKAVNKYYCEVCEKNFNGPKPYGAHMASRGHREEVELAAERD